MFYVKPIYNGQNFPIKGCNETVLTSYRRDGEVEQVDGLCELSTFLNSLKDVLYTGDEESLRNMCYESGEFYSYMGKGKTLRNKIFDGLGTWLHTQQNAPPYDTQMLNLFLQY